MELLKPYFPGNTPTPNFYAHGGSLFSLGIIHWKSKNQDHINFMLNAIKSPNNNQNEQIIHGACLGMGLIGLGSEDESII